MKSTPVNKYLWLLDLLYRKGSLSLEKINAHWRKSPMNELQEDKIPDATFHHWKKSIKLQLGLEIRYNRAENTYSIEEGETFAGGQYFDWMMRSLAVAEVVRNSVELRDRILLEPMPGGEKWLGLIIEAMKGNNVMKMCYQPYGVTEVHEMELKPYCVKTSNLRWYVVGESSNHPEPYRAHALDRIVDIKVLDKTFEMPKGLVCEDIFKDLYGVWIGTDLETEQVVVDVPDYTANFIRSKPIHRSQKESKSELQEGRTEFEWMVKPTPDFISELRKFGKQLRVLRPKWVRKEIW